MFNNPVMAKMANDAVESALEKVYCAPCVANAETSSMPPARAATVVLATPVCAHHAGIAWAAIEGFGNA